MTADQNRDRRLYRRGPTDVLERATPMATLSRLTHEEEHALVAAGQWGQRITLAGLALACVAGIVMVVSADRQETAARHQAAALQAELNQRSARFEACIFPGVAREGLGSVEGLRSGIDRLAVLHGRYYAETIAACRPSLEAACRALVREPAAPALRPVVTEAQASCARLDTAWQALAAGLSSRSGDDGDGAAHPPTGAASREVAERTLSLRAALAALGTRADGP